MKLTFTPKQNGFIEESQPNPIMWSILSGNRETGYNAETGWIRCKDFFNDYVVAYNGGPKFCIYGFNTELVTFPAKGENAFFLVKNCTEHFSENVSEFNTWLEKQGQPAVYMEEYKNGQYVLEIPAFFLKNTYNISLVTLIIRLCNDIKKFGSFEEIIKYKEFASKDQIKWNYAVNKNNFFNIPDKFIEYTWYLTKDVNSKAVLSGYSLSSYVHNNGFISFGSNF